MLNKLIGTLGVGVVLAVIVGLFIVGPVLTILAVNHLFNAGIALNFWNWIAVAWFHIVIAGGTSGSK